MNSATETIETSLEYAAPIGAEVAPPAAPFKRAFISRIPRPELTPWPEQPREHFDQAALDELKQSMQTYGFDEAYPLLCRPLEYQAVRDDVLAKFCIEYRPHETAPWRDVRDDIVFPVGPSWAALQSEDDVQLALAWLPKFQIVDGERRWTEAGELNIHEIPCVVREMTNAEALEKALISALQKKSLNAMEEAEGFGRLIDCDPGNTPKTIAARLGVTLQYVSDRLGIRSLRGTSAGKAIITETFGVAHGRLLGRLPTVELIEEWTKKVLSNPWGPSPMPYRDLEAKLREHVMKELRSCGFDTTDQTLVPLVRNEQTGARAMGGACTDCQFNTRNISENATEKTHMCMFLQCYKAKQHAAYERWRGGIAPHASLSFEENGQLWAASGKALEFDSIYVELEDRPHDTLLKPTIDCKEPWKKLLEGMKVPTLAALDRFGVTHLLVERPIAVVAAYENGHHIFRKEPDGAALGQTPTSVTVLGTGAESIPAVEAAANAMEQEQQSTDAKAAREAEDLEQEVIWLAMIGELVEAITAAKLPPKGFFSLLIEGFGRHMLEGLGIAAERRGVPAEAVEKSLVTDNEMSAAALFVEMVLHEDWWGNGHASGQEEISKWGKAFGVDLKKVASKAKKAHNTALEEQAKDNAKGLGMFWQAHDGKPFEVNSGNVVENPEVCQLVFPKSLKLTAQVEVAELEGQWTWGYFVQGAKNGNSSPCYANDAKYSNRNLAVKAGLLEIRRYLKMEDVMHAGVTLLDEWIALVSTPDPVPGKKPKPKKKPKAKHPAGKVIKAVKGKGKK